MIALWDFIVCAPRSESLATHPPVSPHSGRSHRNNWTNCSSHWAASALTKSCIGSDTPHLRWPGPDSLQRDSRHFWTGAIPFGFDWLGRQFAVDRDRTGPSGHLCLLLEPGTRQALELPFTAVELHQDGLIDLTDAALAVDLRLTMEA